MQSIQLLPFTNCIISRKNKFVNIFYLFRYFNSLKLNLVKISVNLALFFSFCGLEDLRAVPAVIKRMGDAPTKSNAKNTFIQK